jgi:large subunit ribosomal protein L5
MNMNKEKQPDKHEKSDKVAKTVKSDKSEKTEKVKKEFKPVPKPKLQEEYESKVVGELMEKFGFKNKLAVPRISKIVINMGIGEARENPKIIESARKDLAMIVGQMPKVTRSKKAISNFKIREGQAIGCAVTLRGKRMYEFLHRFISVACPRIRDFRGFMPHSFDGRGNYTFGLTEQSIFPELEMDKVDHALGMSISINTTANNDEQGRALLMSFGFPFRRQS